MITYKYDKSAGCGYISIGSTSDGKRDPIGTMEVSAEGKRNIRYRKPTYEEEFKGLVLLDFDVDQKLVGIELVGNSVIPEIAQKDSVLFGAYVEVNASPDKNLHECIEEANALHSMLHSQGIGNVVKLDHGGTIYTCDGSDPDKIIAFAETRKKRETRDN
jgi:uncharacterized protein YuzE